MLVPTKLLITPQTIHNSELAKMIEAYPKIFKDEEGWDQNCLCAFLLYEKIKGIYLYINYGSTKHLHNL